MSRDFRFWSVEILWTVQSPHSRELTLAVPKLPIYVETIVPREPVRTTLRFAAGAAGGTNFFLRNAVVEGKEVT